MMVAGYAMRPTNQQVVLIRIQISGIAKKKHVNARQLRMSTYIVILCGKDGLSS
jgi:hypothetical protein